MGQKASNHGLVFLATSPHLKALWEPTKRCLMKTKGTPIPQEIPRDLGALCQEPGQRPNIKQKKLLGSPYHLGNYKGFRSSVPEPGAETRMQIFLLFHKQTPEGWNRTPDSASDHCPASVSPPLALLTYLLTLWPTLYFSIVSFHSSSSCHSLHLSYILSFL